jgi:hypothetical protein
MMEKLRFSSTLHFVQQHNVTPEKQNPLGPEPKKRLALRARENQNQKQTPERENSWACAFWGKPGLVRCMTSMTSTSSTIYDYEYKASLLLRFAQ